MDNMSLSDIAAVTRGNDGFFGGAGGSGMWIFALLILLLLGNNGNGLFGSNATVTTADLCMNNQFQNLSQNVNEIGNRQFSQANELTKGISQLGYTTLENFNGIGSKIDSVRFDMANYVASINANTSASMQKILDTIQADKIASLQSQVSDLKTQQMFCGIPRISNYAYGVYQYPSCGCGCSGNI